MANEVTESAPVTSAPAQPAPAGPAAAPAPQVAASAAQPVHPPAQSYGVHPAVVHQEQGFYQKVWFWVVLAIAMLVISIVGSVCGTYIYRAMAGTTTPGAFRLNGGQTPGGGMYFNNGGGSGNGYNRNGNGNGNGNGNSGSGSSGNGSVTQ